MRLSLRFPPMLILAGIAYAVAPLVDQLTRSWFVRDLDIRTCLIANTIQEPPQERLATGNKGKIEDFVAGITQNERLYAISYCASPTGQVWASRSLPQETNCAELDRRERTAERLLQGTQGPLQVAVQAMSSEASAMRRRGRLLGNSIHGET